MTEPSPLPPEHGQIVEFVEHVHRQLWTGWFSDVIDADPAAIAVHFESGETGLDECGTMHIRYEAADVEFAMKDAHGLLNAFVRVGWSSVRRDVIHETLHEYQYKVLSVPTEAGRALYASRAKRFPGRGHDEIFYSAIAHWASYFDLSPQQFEIDL